jgi:hypothetical protein
MSNPAIFGEWWHEPKLMIVLPADLPSLRWSGNEVLAGVCWRVSKWESANFMVPVPHLWGLH